MFSNTTGSYSGTAANLQSIAGIQEIHESLAGLQNRAATGDLSSNLQGDMFASHKESYGTLFGDSAPYNQVLKRAKRAQLKAQKNDNNLEVDETNLVRRAISQLNNPKQRSIQEHHQEVDKFVGLKSQGKEKLQK